MKEDKQKLFAIWQYDCAPYYLGGEVIELCEGGLVKVKGYDSCRFKYFKLYPLKEGQKIYDLIVQAGNIYQESIEKAKGILKFDTDRYLGL